MDRIALVDRGRRDRPGIKAVPPRLEFRRAGETLFVPIHVDRPLGHDPSIRRLVVVIQGDRRRPADYLEAVGDAARAAGAADTAVMAPHFRIASELEPQEREAGAAYWSPSGWKEGALSRLDPWGRAWRISSFSVVDGLLRAVIASGIWPGLGDVVIAGHSAGGQFVQRYAAGSRPVTRATSPSPRLRFVVANPSSYLYLTADRLSAATGRFEPLTDDQLAACPRADRYKYGLRGRNEYMSRSGRVAIRRRYRDQSIDYVIGELDTDTKDDRLDATCPGMLQGATRNARGRTFHRYLGHLFGTEVHGRHHLLEVTGIGHDVHGIFGAPAVRAALFRAPALTPVPS